MSNNVRRPRVLICDPIDQAGIDLLQSVADVDLLAQNDSADLLTIVTEYDALVVRSATHISADVIAHGLHLKVIARAGSGLDTIDVAAAQAAGIEVVNSPDANTISVAEHTMGLMLALARRLPYADAALKKGIWEKQALMGTGLSGKTLGIVGFGRIGREVAARAHAFGMRIIVNQPEQTPELKLDDKVTNVDLNDLLRQSDFVTFHVPLTPKTRNMISAEQLAMMKSTAYLINTARGEIIDDDALLAALDAGEVSGAALDVFRQEPAVDNALAQHPRVIATPHIAASTHDAQRSAALTVAQKIVDVFQDVELESVLPLRVVPMDKVVPHESVDPQRVKRLAARLQSDKILSNPPVVTEVDGHYMVLDGATRTAALKQIGLPHVIVQVISEEEGLGLHTWFHVVQQISADALLDVVGQLDEVSLRAVDADSADEMLFEYGGLCYLKLIDGRVMLVEPQPGVNRLHALNQFTEAYIAASAVERTLESNMITLQHEYPEMIGLVVFPEFTVGQVMQVTMSGRYFPAGITRFIIPGRVLRLNADLEFLMSDKTLREKNRWLHEMLLHKAGKGRIRYYGEPVYILDE